MDNGLDREQVRRLVRSARGGDEEAFGELVKMYHERVCGLAYGLVSNAEDAKEIAQQTWVKVWNKLRDFKGDAEFFTWVYRVASNASLDFLRHKTRLREDSLVDGVEPQEAFSRERAPSENPRPDREAERAEIRRVFEQALESLSSEHRLALTLREVEGLSYDEIAKVMKCRKGTVMSRIFYARRAMQEKLKELQ
ncbi:MAG: sigma-70 family RNA polymerase sigma factor [Planctomycetota bacterium]